MKTLFITEIQGGMYQEMKCRDGRLACAGVVFFDLPAVYTYARLHDCADVCIVAGVAHLKGGI